jgi:hypothetical protein
LLVLGTTIAVWTSLRRRGGRPGLPLKRHGLEIGGKVIDVVLSLVIGIVVTRVSLLQPWVGSVLRGRHGTVDSII